MPAADLDPRTVRALVLVVLLAAPVLGAAAPRAVEEAPELAVAGGISSLAGPGAFERWDEDGIEPPRDRCPDAGETGAIDDAGCPLDLGRFGDRDGDHLMNGRSVAVERDSPLSESLRRRGIVGGVLRDGRGYYFGEASVGTDPDDPNTDRLDRLGDGLEVALRHGITPAARLGAYGARVVEPEGVPRADPLVPDEYLELRYAIVGTKTYWNEALEAALADVVQDDLAPEANATYAPPSVRLHVFVGGSVPLADGTLTVDELVGTKDRPSVVEPHLERARRGFALPVIVVPEVEWAGESVAGLAVGDRIVVAVAHKGFDACEAEGGRPGTPACDELMRLFRWTLNHERLHPYGLPDRVGGDDLMSTAPGVYAARPHESAARFAWFDAHPEKVVTEWRRERRMAPDGG